MGYLIDTNVWIEAARGRISLDDFFGLHQDDEFALSVITASELLHGIHRAVNPLIREKRQSFVNEILRRIPVMAFDLPVARVHAALWAECAQRGEIPGSHDLIIAATALHCRHAVVTFNLRDFQRIPGLNAFSP